MKNASAREAAEHIVRTLHDAGHAALLAGGCVRDTIMGTEPNDFDVATDAPPDRVVKLFRRTNQVGAKFGVVLVYEWGRQIEVATFRSDGAYTDGRHPDSITFGDAAADAARRDFTINGMFLDVRDGRIIDHVGGQDDLRRRLVRAIGDPATRFAEDHLRMLRAVRFSARLGFEIEPATLAAIRATAERLVDISAERIREELRLVLTHPTRAAGWGLIVETRLANHMVAGVGFSRDESIAVESRLAALDGNPDFVLVLAAVLRHLPPADAEAACRRLACSNDESRGVGWLLHQLPRVHEVDRLDLADIKMLLAHPRFGELTALLRADLLAAGAPTARHEQLTQRSAKIPEADIAPPPFVTGEDLISRNVPHGPVYATVLSAIYREQLNLRIADRASALRRLDELLRLGRDAGQR